MKHRKIGIMLGIKRRKTHRPEEEFGGGCEGGEREDGGGETFQRHFTGSI